MREGIEILTTKSKFEFIERRPYLFLGSICVFCLLSSLSIVFLSERVSNLFLELTLAAFVLIVMTFIAEFFNKSIDKFEYFTVNY